MLRYIAEYIPFYLSVKALSSLPLPVSVRMGRRLGRLLYFIDRKHRKIAAENISLSLGMDRAGADAVAKKVFENLGMTFAEFLKLPAIGKDYFEENIVLEGYENFTAAKAEGNGVFLLSAHLGNWEMLGASHLKRGGLLSGVYKETKNPYVNRLIDSIRKSFGAKTIPHKNSVKEIISVLKRGEGVAILLDQHADSREAVAIDFLGRPAATSMGLALLALRTGAPVVPAFLLREKEGRFRCIYEKPIYLDRGQDMETGIRDATVRFSGVIEKYVREYPEQWFWVHRRWKI